MRQHRIRPDGKQPAGIALITSLLLVVLMLLLGLSFLSVALSESLIAANSVQRSEAFYLAEAGVESLFVDLRDTLANFSRPTAAQLPTGSSLAPGGIRAPQNGRFAYDFSGATPETGVGFLTGTSGNPHSTKIDRGTWQSMNAIASDYVVRARVTGPRGVQAHVSQAVQYLEIPLFQFGVFYGRGVDLEIAPGPVMTFNGRVHANSNIFVVANSGISFDSYLTTAGNIYRYIKRDGTIERYNNPMIKDTAGTYRPLNFDHESSVGFSGAWSEEAWRTQAKATFGGLLLDKAMGVNEIVPPIPDLYYNPSNPDVISHQLIEGQASGESAAVQAAKLYYQADLRIVNGVATLKNGTTVDLASQCSGTVAQAKTFHDRREAKTMTVTEVNVAALRTCSFLASTGTVLYVSDSGIDRAVRLVNGSEVTAGGLTVVTDNPMYIQGDYNTVNKKPSAVMADAITVLSNNWGPNGSDSKGNLETNTRPASDTTVNAAFALGPSAESAAGQGNGQLENVIRFLENWGGKNFNYRGSIVSLWHSQKVSGRWRCCGSTGDHYYQAPNRNWGYDTMFDTELPPGTPRAVQVVKSRWQG